MMKKMFALVIVGCFPWVVGAEAEISCPDVQIVEVESWAEKWAGSNREVLGAYAHFREVLHQGLEKGKLTVSDIEKIQRAVSFAAEKHAKQFRNNGRKTPYIIHPIGVADYVIRIGGVYDIDIIIGALLHDVMDDTDVTYEEIATYFGMQVVQYVQEMTGDPSLTDKENQKRQIIQASHHSKGTSIIKLADKLHNMHTLMKDPSDGWSQDGLDRHFQWVQAVIDQLPKVNKPLQEEVEKTIAIYWQGQGS